MFHDFPVRLLNRKSSIGMRQTAKLQVTDIREAVIRKRAATPIMASRRRLHRIAAKRKGVAPNMCSRHLDLMHIAIAMQRACIKDNENEKGILKAFRMGGWLAYKPTPSGLQAAVGEAYRKFPLGSSRLSRKLIEQRFDWVDKEGRPQRPDWNELKEIRERQQLLAVEKQAETTCNAAQVLLGRNCRAQMWLACRACTCCHSVVGHQHQAQLSTPRTADPSADPVPYSFAPASRRAAEEKRGISSASGDSI